MKTEKRKQKRFPVVKDLAEPVDLFMMDEAPREVPAILTNLSSGGMSLMVFAQVSGDTRMRIMLNLPGLEGIRLEGQVAWTQAKGDTTSVGVRFSHVGSDDTRRINRMAEAYQDCELKLSFGLLDVCFRDCSYWPLCNKPVKLKH